MIRTSVSTKLGVSPKLPVLLLAVSGYLAEWLRITKSAVVTG